MQHAEVKESRLNIDGRTREESIIFIVFKMSYWKRIEKLKIKKVSQADKIG